MRKSEIPPRRFFLAEDSARHTTKPIEAVTMNSVRKTGYRRARRAQEIGKGPIATTLNKPEPTRMCMRNAASEGKHDLGAENTVETSQEYRPDKMRTADVAAAKSAPKKSRSGKARQRQDNENREAHRTLSDQKTLHELNGSFGIVHKEAVDARIERASQRPITLLLVRCNFCAANRRPACTGPATAPSTITLI